MSANTKVINRVAITGMGMINGLGHNLKDVWANAIEGKSGVSQNRVRGVAHLLWPQGPVSKRMPDYTVSTRRGL